MKIFQSKFLKKGKRRKKEGKERNSFFAIFNIAVLLRKAQYTMALVTQALMLDNM